MDLQPSIEVSAKLTNWKREPTLQQLKLDWEGAKQHQGTIIANMDRWNDLIKVKGAAKPKARKGRSRVQPKLIRRQNEWRYSALTEPFVGTDKLFQIKPTTYEDVKAAQQNELILNYQFRTKINKLKLIDDYVRSNVDEGTVILQTGWNRVTVPVTEKVPVYQHVLIQNEQQLQTFQQALELKQANPREYNEKVSPELKAAIDFYDESGEATVAVPTGEFEEVKTEKILANHPTLVVRDPKNVFIDPSCGGDLDKALFVCVSFETNKADLIKEGKRYKNLDKVNWEANSPLSQPDHATMTPDTFNLQDKSRKKVVAYEYWGFFPINDDDVLVPFVCTWIGDVIIRMELNPFPDQKLPFIVVPYLPVKRELYGEPDAELLEDNQAILGAVTRGMIDLLGRSANGQQGFAKGMLDPLNRRRYEEGNDYEFNPNTTPQMGLIEHKYPEIPQSALLMLNLQNQEAEALTGVKSFAGGISGDALGEVAASVRGVLDAASKREMAILRRLAWGICEAGKKIIAMNQAFLSEQEVVRVTNDEFVTVFREELQSAAEFDLIVDISTAEIDNAQAENLSFMLQTLGNNVPVELTMLLLAEIARLKRMPELEKQLRDFKPQPDPLEVRKKELEIQKLEMEIAELQSKSLLNEAKAGEAEAKADKTNLDFVEQETGTKHERDLELVEGQAQGNKELAVTKALTTPTKEGEKAPDIEAAVGYNELTRGNRRNGGATVPPIMPQTPTLPVDTLSQTEDLSNGLAFTDPDVGMNFNPGMSEV